MHANSFRLEKIEIKNMKGAATKTHIKVSIQLFYIRYIQYVFLDKDKLIV